MKTSIILLTFNQLHYTKLCIDSIRKYTDKNTYEIIVVDNHSTDGTVQWLKAQKDIKCIFNEENLGFPKGCNQGIKIAKGNSILLLNNDVVVTPNWLANLNACLYSADDIGAVGAVTNNCSYYQSISVNYKNIEEMIAFSQKNNISSSTKWEKRLKLIGFCMLIKREVIQKIGLLDERFSPGNFEDDDYSFRIIKAGYKLMLCKDVFIHHFGHASFNKNSNEFSNILTINRNFFKEKWGFDPWKDLQIQNALIHLIDHFHFEKINVLEINCGCGATLLYIKNIYKNANLYGIEQNQEALKIACTFADVQCIDIENEKLPYKEKYFDYIIFGNVLEYLYNPLKVLKCIKKYMKNSGKILSSIPNIIHYINIRNLVKGNLIYDEQAPIRFFTLNTINNIFMDADYKIETITGRSTTPSEDDKKFIDSLNHMVEKNMTKQYKFQEYFIKARNNTDENTEFKFLLRRIENNISIEKNTKFLVEMIYNSKLNLNTLMNIIDMNIIKKDKVLNQLAYKLCEKNMYEYAKVLLSRAYEINPQNIKTQKLLKSIEGEQIC
ncbi:glycosyltransferase [Crassaminicella indica]|uniref:Glycosyltransferase n=1 Tax=Crassaminicella indica TaxID=2855394 RepID=A0ABX8RBF0_9CLOT|nr:glycosyltransferase [Crassaminicella indica]QXM06348.1 glycosyltransferase [Crassaminicella indica]